VKADAEVRTEFSLRKLAREVWDEAAGADHHALAKEVQRRITPAQRDAALGEALIEYMRVFNSNRRPASRISRGAGQRNSGRSAKVAGIRHAWPQLRATYFTKDGQKALGECSRADVIFIAEHLEKKARENQAKAGWMRELSAALSAHKVQCVRDLPDDVLAQFLEGAAA
jgi:hypothetical protein